ncbi:MAG: PQQ-binding-like beta-propeller repeat protein [Pirellulales bacterium]
MSTNGLQLWTAGRRLGLAFLGVAAALTAGLAAAADAWPQWRGPTRDGQVSGVDWPASLQGERLVQRWRVELGASYSGPLVVDDRVFVTETVDKKKELVKALDRTTGKVLWTTEWEGALSVPFFAKSNGDWIRSTPAYADGRLYVAGMRDVLVCLDARDGKQIWRVDFVEALKTPLPSFGFVCSPLVIDGAVYVQAGAAVVKLDAATGQIVWKTLNDNGGMEGSAFSSPVLVSLADQPQLVVQTRQKLAGVNPADGAVLWSEEVPAFRGMNILTPMLHEGRFFTSAYGGKSLAYTVEKKDGKYEVSTAWENKTQGYMSTPVIIDGHAYLHLRNQRFTCIELATGKEKWTTPKTFGKYWSLVANKNRILALDERGDLLLIEATPAEFKLIDQRHISDQETWAHLAVVGHELYVRELNAMTVYDWRP